MKNLPKGRFFYACNLVGRTKRNVPDEKKPSRNVDWADTNIGVNKKKAAT
ncbi:hypothetical protein VspSTUT11_18340 [Vibrio sp. STUT-A11]|nr:hypothetical protein VspSTUT11_18340 [Vibrio sp. STUT-A11]